MTAQLVYGWGLISVVVCGRRVPRVFSNEEQAMQFIRDYLCGGAQ